MARTLTVDHILAAAEGIVDEGGPQALTMAAIAQAVGVRGPSLYSHVAGLDVIRAQMQARSMSALSSELQQAAMGRSGGDALRAMCDAFRTFALRHPNRYVMMTAAAVDRQLMFDASLGADSAVRAALRGFALDDDEVFAAEVALFATAHGFVSLQVSGVFAGGMDADGADRLYTEAIERFVASLEHQLHPTKP